MQEIDILRGLSSVHVVSLFEYGMWKERPFMVLQYADNTLSDVVQEAQSISTILNGYDAFRFK